MKQNLKQQQKIIKTLLKKNNIKVIGRRITDRGEAWIDKREVVIPYITNIIKRRPPENRDPLPKEIEAYAPYLSKQIEIINPKLIVPLGRFAMNYFVPIAKISNDQGKLFWWEDKLVIPLYHPAAALRSTKVMEKLEKSSKRLPIALKKYEDFLKERNPTTEEEPEQLPLF